MPEVFEDRCLQVVSQVDTGPGPSSKPRYIKATASTHRGAPLAWLGTRYTLVTIATISKQGLLALAILVAVLWGCWLVQQHYLAQARRNVRGAALNIQRLQRKSRRTLPSVLPGRPRRAERASFS